MKKTLIINSCLNLVEYTVVYLIIVFCNWNFHNPFQWLIDLPIYSPQDRFLILFGICFWQFFQILLIHKK